MQLLLDKKEFNIVMSDEDFKRYIEIIMADEDVQFKVKKLIINQLSRSQVYILDWLLLKSPNLIEIQIYPFF